jgi:low molecular weight phosphotyrosine protein phosphatase
MSKFHYIFQVKKADFSEFDYIFGMDDDNIDDLKSMAPATFKAKIEMLSKYDAGMDADRTIRDPYYVSFNALSLYMSNNIS